MIRRGYEDLYLLCATKYSDVKANNTFIERKLKIVATTRISATISKLVELGSERESRRTRMTPLAQA